MNRIVDSQFLIKVLQNRLNPEEEEFFDKWLLASDKNKEDFSTISLIWDKAEHSQTPNLPDSHIQWHSIAKELNLNNLSESRTSYFKNFTQNSLKPSGKSHLIKEPAKYNWLIRIAAILIITLGFNFIIGFNNDNPTKENLEDKSTVKQEVYELKTQNGERKTFLLADGTTVYLNSDSKLFYPKSFSGKFREVSISGEAYFAVKSNANQPFKVQLGAAEILVTGTEFNIKNRDNRLSVIVTKGSVITYCSKLKSSHSLHKGQMVSYSDNKGFSKPTYVDVNKYLAWRSNKFFFEKAQLSEVMAEIERYYNIKVHFSSDSLRRKSITGTFSSGSLEEIFSILSLTLDVKIKYDGKKVIVS